MPDGTLYFEQTHYPFAESDERAGGLARAFADSMWTSPLLSCPPGPLADGEAGLRVLREGAARLRGETDRAIVGLFGGSLFETGQFLYRSDNFFLLLAGEPAKAERFLDMVVESHLSNLERFLGAVGDSIDIVLFGDDLGMQTGPQISPAMYSRFFKPRHSLMWKRAKELGPAGRGGDPKRPALRVMLHCCGGIRELLPDLIHAGADAINPVQITCGGMEPAGLKRDFGRDIVFWGGGCDTRMVLPGGTPQEVHDHVRRQVEIFSRDGGFVFQQVHNILANVPPKNIEAMFDAVRG
jgi:uroporphyrinogen decarboxylase